MHVFEVNGEILRFATLLMVDKLYAEPEGYVKFSLGFRPDSVSTDRVTLILYSSTFR